ncbi:hypothetical protein [Burkholderia latens]|uniref:hypothetical protein n=1 Tax=Burkholderia latens TaxID=488446 RepID=UPI00158BFB1A|nr:hypothetical protein [Burkholderia latens]
MAKFGSSVDGRSAKILKENALTRASAARAIESFTRAQESGRYTAPSRARTRTAGPRRAIHWPPHASIESNMSGKKADVYAN